MSPLFKVNEIEEDSAKGFTIDKQKIFAVKKDGQLYIYLNSCPHLNINLEFQPDQFLDSESRFIQCVNHGALFEIDSGKCIAGPCSGQSLTTVNFEIKDDEVYLTSIPAD